MLIKSILSIFAVAAAATAQSVNDFTYHKFPTTKALCPISGSKDTTTWTLQDLKELAIAASKGPMYDPSAGNVGGGCGGMYGIPMYIIGDARGVTMMSVAVDLKNMSITLCGLQGGDVDGEGYNDSCELD